MSSSDVETFNGKIVYNLDGSALIIDAGNASVSSKGLNSSGAIPTGTHTTTTTTTLARLVGGGKGADKIIKSSKDQVGAQQGQTETDNGSDTGSRISFREGDYQLSPKIHSFRVISAQDASTHCQDPANAFQTHKHKPILMCFICKLSFGNVNSFSLHAKTEHRLNLEELEQQLLNREYSSAIIQRNMDEKPQISFLQPLDVNQAADTRSGGNNFVESVQDQDQSQGQGQDIVDPQLTNDAENFSIDHHDHRNDDGDGDRDDDGGDIALAMAMAAPKVAVKSTVKLSSLNSATSKTNIPITTKTKTITSTNTPTSTTTPASSLNSSISSCVSPVSTSTATQSQSKVLLPSAPAEKTTKTTDDDNVEAKLSDDTPLVDVKATSTDSISNDKSLTKRSGTGLGSPPPPAAPVPASVSLPNSAASAEPTAADILQQHLLSLQEQQQQKVIVTGGGVFPPIQAQAQAQSHISSFHASLTALANEQNARGVKLLTDFLQQQLQHQQQQQQHTSLFPTNCLEHPDFKGVDCKACELIDVQPRMKSPATPQSQSQSQIQSQPQQSPNTSSCGGLSTSMPISPSASSVASVGNATASSFTIGACSEHVNGRPQGVDCTRCEMLLNSARLNSGVQMSTRNSCKTLKCPQCNWHYKYQETLEIHMREKHPDGESACGYCLAGQQHPRLARGESYSCGYKPYRCEICNYSTTTKGNLSIHMQSDKHLNNMQELNSSQNMVAAAAAAASAKLLLPSPSSQGPGPGACSISIPASQQQPTICSSNAIAASASTGNTSTGSNVNSATAAGTVSSTGGSLKPKPSFRCDICSYETSVARNLRIHMTSEKHTHNMAVLQNNIKHIQALNFLQQQQGSGSSAGAVTVAGANVNSFLAGPEVALADLAYNQALMIQLLQQNAVQQQQTAVNSKLSPTSPSPVSTPDQFSFSPQSLKISQGMGLGMGVGVGMSMGMNIGMGMGHTSESAPSGEALETSQQSTSLPELWPTALYSCLICDSFSTNNMDELNQHLLLDRSRQSSNASTDIMVIHNNNYICRLCNYKTNLKANFQLHSKTDKHLQKLNFINHIREGGSRTEYKLQYQPQLSTNVVQLKCNCCDFHTNSIQKLSLHTQQMRHDTMRMIFQHLLYIIQQSRMRKDVVSFQQQDGRQQDHQQDHQCQSQKLICCQLCNFGAKNLHDMVLHVKGLRHMQVEQFICLQRRSENLEMLALNEVFKVTDKLSGSAEDAILDADVKLGKTVCGVATTEAGLGGQGAESNIFSPASISSCSTTGGKGQNQNPNQILQILSPLETVGDSLSLCGSSTTTVFKCNLCEYFVQSRKEILLHLEAMHPTAENEDFISIPTNAAALQAFQAAVAAAALAAVQRCNATPTAAEEDREAELEADTESNECQFDIKCEQMDENDDPIENQSKVHDNNSGKNYTESNRNLVESRPEPSGVSCPLCLESGYNEKSLLETHLMSVHSVTRDGLARLLQLVDQKAWQSSTATDTSSTGVADKCVAADDYTSLSKTTTTSSSCLTGGIGGSWVGSGVMQGISCHQCEAGFKHEEQLLQHAQQTQHYPVQNTDYLCLSVSHVSRPCFMTFATLPSMIAHFKDSHMSLVISERHVYKYRCKQCSLAFKTQEKLTTHMMYHSMRDATKCSLCHRNFRSTHALQKHMEQIHTTECAAIRDGSPRDVSPSSNSNIDLEKLQAETSPFDFSATRPSELDAKMNETVKRTSQQSPFQTDNKESTETSALLSPNTLETPPTEQEQHFAALTAALLKQQRHQRDNESLEPDGQMLPLSPGEFAHQLEKSQQQHPQGPFESMNPQSLQGLQSLQSLQQMQQQLSAAAATSGMPINPVDMLNLMQFHHLMSLNFMNLAPPLIFGANATGGNNTGETGASGVQNNGIASTSLSLTGTSSACLADSAAKLTGDASNMNILSQSTVTINNNQQQLTNNQKRARTRITDDQLKILRAHFDINNSPSEESIMEMSQKANLPMKVVKHWFRNTLFKERQRNKDSPYNFNNPPSTTLNLEEYERTGQAKVTSLSNAAPTTQTITIGTGSGTGTGTAVTGTVTPPTHERSNPTVDTSTTTATTIVSTNSTSNIPDYFRTQADTISAKSEQEELIGLPLPLEVQIKTEPQDDTVVSTEFAAYQKKERHQPNSVHFLKQHQVDAALEPGISHPDVDALHDHSLLSSGSSSVQNYPNQQQQSHQQQQQQQQVNCFETKSESGSSDVLSRPQTPNSIAAGNLYSSMNDLLNQQFESMGSNMGPPKKLQIASKSFEKLSGTVSVAGLVSASTCPQLESNSSNSSNSSSSTSGGKRANRTRFTDYQIKVLQEFFENNSYPKDSDLEYLSKLLLLSPRVIVVWFQNARQKQRKIYENQPNNSLYESEETKKQNINYACKKCSLVFQRYYELIRHQKNHCFKEENNKKSAKAQIAAAQIAQNLSSEDSNSSMDIHHSAAAAAVAGAAGLSQNVAAAVAVAAAAAAAHSHSHSGSGSHSQHFGSSPSPQHLFSKSSSLTDFSPSTTPTPPQRERSNSLDQQQQRMPKFECDKCELQFNHLELLREHQLMHLMNPALFNHQSNQSEASYGPFGSILQSLQQAAQQQKQHQTESRPPPAKKRKHSEGSSTAEEATSIGEFESTSGSHGKNYEFLYQYFMQHETNIESKQQFLLQHQQQQHHGANDTHFEMDFLSNFYQQSELKKINSYDFLIEYYQKNNEESSLKQEQSSFSSSNKPTIEFLLQYYQLNESKKFFQLVASPQITADGTGSMPSSHQPNVTTDEMTNFIGSRGYDEQDHQQGQEGEHEHEHKRTTLYSNTKSQINGEEKSSENELGQTKTTVPNDIVDSFERLNNNHININFGLAEEKNFDLTRHPKEPHDNFNANASASSNHNDNDNQRTDTISKLQSDNQSIIGNKHNGLLRSSERVRNSNGTDKTQYFQNLEDFLDATMIENNSEMLTFNDDNDIPSPKIENSAITSTVNANDSLPSDSSVQLCAPSKQNKRLRTTILPEQLNFLYECYQNESNPSRKMLEEISKKVNLKKRVVQ